MAENVFVELIPQRERMDEECPQRAQATPTTPTAPPNEKQANGAAKETKTHAHRIKKHPQK